MSGAARKSTAAAAAAIALLFASGGAAADEDRKHITGQHDDVVIAAGEEVLVEASVTDDVIVAGEDVRVRTPTAIDIFAAGEEVLVEPGQSANVFAAGRQVELAGAVDRRIMAAGERIHLRSGASVGGNAYLAARKVEVSGAIDGTLRAAGRRVLVSGVIGGDAIIIAERVIVAPGARIAGVLRYASEHEAEVAEDAEIGGGVERDQRFAELSEEFDLEGPGLWGFLGVLLAFILFAAVVQGLFPRILESSSDRLRARPAITLLIGFATLVAAPVAGALLAATVIGIPIAVFLFAVYGALLLVAVVTPARAAALTIRDIATRATAAPSPLPTFGWTALGLVALAILVAIPWLGMLVTVLVLSGGLGGLLPVLWARVRAA